MFLGNTLSCFLIFLFFCKGNSVQVDICSNNILTFENETVHVVTPNYPNYDLNANYDCSCNFSSNENIQFIKKEATLSLLPNFNAIMVYYEYEGGIKGYFLHKLIDSPSKKDLMIHYVRTKTVSWFRKTYGKFNLQLSASSPVNITCFSNGFVDEFPSTTSPTTTFTESNNQTSAIIPKISTKKTITYGEPTTDKNLISTLHSTHLTTTLSSNSSTFINHIPPMFHTSTTISQTNNSSYNDSLSRTGISSPSTKITILSPSDEKKQDTRYNVEEYDTEIVENYEKVINIQANEVKNNEIRTPLKLLQRWTLLKSAHTYRQKIKSYEARKNVKEFQFNHLTGARRRTTHSFLEYIQWNKRKQGKEGDQKSLSS